MDPTLFLALALGLAAADGPPLTVASPVIDRGEVKAGLPLVQTFELVNRSAEPLVIEQVASGCGCLQPKLARRELPPGESARLEIAVNTLSQPAGPQTWSTAVRYRQGERVGALELQIRARVVREVEIEPVALALTIDKGATHAVTLTDRRPKPLTITAAHTTSPGMQARLGVRTVGPNGESRQRVHVTIADDFPAGQRTETLQMVTDDADYREFRIPVTINRRPTGQVAALPDRVELRLAKGQTTANSLVRLRDAEGRPVVVDRMESDSSLVRSRWAAGPESMATLRLGVELAADAPSGVAVVTVYLKEPPGQVLKIPVQWQR